jgi:predicted ATP-grasp superfamily ATP-dependent carboligase
VADRLSALVLDGDTRMALVAIRCLARAGRSVGVVSTVEETPSIGEASRYPRVRAVVPDPVENEADYVAALLELLDRCPTDVVIPTSDRSVAVLRRHRDELTSRTALALASEPALSTAVDKRSTLDTARRLGLSVPCGELVVREEQLLGEPVTGFPCVVKPTESWAVGSARVGRLRCQLAVDETELRTAVAETLAAGAGALVQQWLPGRREAVHLLYARGQFWASACVAAFRTAPALGGDSIMRVTIPPLADVVAAAEKLVRAMDLEGYSEVEFRRDAHGRPVLMEVNPRLSASVETVTRAGVDFPVLLHDWARGAPLRRVEHYRAGVRLRWVGGELRWLHEVWRHPGRPDVPALPRAVGNLLADTLRPSAYDLVDLRDLRPAVRKVTKAVRRSRHASRGRRVRP